MTYDPIAEIINEVAQPVSGGRAGVDLTCRKDELRKMLTTAHQIYAEALDDWETRTDPNKPKRILEKNWGPDEPELKYDYGDDAGAGFSQSWEEWWLKHYHRRRGNPGRGRTKDLPVEPLHSVYVFVRGWWLHNVDPKGFRPDFPRAFGEGPRYDKSFFNPAGRLLLMVAQDINIGYSANICANLYDAAKRRRRHTSSE
jgi:hypothetical protein